MEATKTSGRDLHKQEKDLCQNTFNKHLEVINQTEKHCCVKGKLNMFRHWL